MKKYTTWLKAAAIFQFLNVLMHSVTLFITPAPANDSEKQLYALMDTYKFDFCAGFQPTMNDMTLVFSACLCLLCLLAGWLNFFLLAKKVETRVMKGVININLVVFAILSALTIAFTFLMPIIFIGLIVVCLIFASVTVGKSS